MKLEQAAYVNLVALARADRRLDQGEVDLIEEYREVLGVTREFADEIEQTASLRVVLPKELDARPADRLQIVKMMIRVGFADGAITARERRLLKKVARSLGIGPVALSGLLWEIRRELGIRRRLRTSKIVAAAMIIVAVAAVWIVISQVSSETSEQLDAARLDFDELKNELGLERAEAEEVLRRVRRSYAESRKNEIALTRRLEELEEKNAAEREALKTALTAEQKKRQDAMESEIEQLRGALARVRDLNATFQEIEKRSDASILLILTTYDLVLGSDRIMQASMGTGFFVTSSGHIVTNKHVVQPWKFDADQILLIDNGAVLDEASILLAAWTAGTDVKTAQGGVNLDDAFSTAGSTLAVAATTPDTFEEQLRPLRSGSLYRGQFHTATSGDLALLKAMSPAPVLPLPLEPDPASVNKLDMVMVMGFPTGIHILETTKAASSPSLGEVRKIENSILVTAPIVPGNSGGPLIDSRGNVAGVAAANFGDSTLGSCIPSMHILPLLPTAAELLENAQSFEKGKSYRAALDDLHLAGQRCDDDTTRAAIDESRTRLLAIRDAMTAEARMVEDRTRRKKAFEAVVEAFGIRWAPDAVSALDQAK